MISMSVDVFTRVIHQIERSLIIVKDCVMELVGVADDTDACRCPSCQLKGINFRTLRLAAFCKWQWQMPAFLRPV